jgi:glutamate 5-kinase
VGSRRLNLGTPVTTDIVGDASSIFQDLGSCGTEGMPLALPFPVEDAVKDVVDSARWEAEEVGRGLANYNSAQVDKVKGLNRRVAPSSALFRSPSLISRILAPTF